jgi:hypothetical protein
MGEMGKGEMGTAHAGKPPSLPRELRTPLVNNWASIGNQWRTRGVPGVFQ